MGGETERDSVLKATGVQEFLVGHMFLPSNIKLGQLCVFKNLSDNISLGGRKALL